MINAFNGGIKEKSLNISWLMMIYLTSNVGLGFFTPGLPLISDMKIYNKKDKFYNDQYHQERSIPQTTHRNDFQLKN